VTFFQQSLILTVALLFVSLSLKYVPSCDLFLHNIWKKFLRNGRQNTFFSDNATSGDYKLDNFEEHEMVKHNVAFISAKLLFKKCALIVIMVLVYLFMTMTMIPLSTNLKQ
jgi:hypothetical protein